MINNMINVVIIKTNWTVKKRKITSSCNFYNQIPPKVIKSKNYAPDFKYKI